MNRKYIIWGIVVVVVLYLVSGYNSLVKSRESVNSAWANVQSEYQRRLDLIDNLVQTVKGSADFEKSTLEAVVQARASATSIRVDANDLTPEKLQQIQREQAQISGALGRLLAVAENYPQLKTTEAFMKLQDQLEGTENRIKMSRNEFNEAARSYNTTIQSFPKNIFAGIFGFKTRPYFESDPGAERAPKVDFNKK
jgi:LemA protein